jgi:hypothetical protein
VAYATSIALRVWLNERRESIDRLAEAHAAMGEIEGPGRPLELGRPIAHAYIIRLLAEFQGFIRDLHDLSAEHLVTVANPPSNLVAVLTAAITRGRAIDSGNATITTLRTDFSRLGIRNIGHRLAARDARWDPLTNGSDLRRYNALVSLRNALAHGNQRQVDELRRQGHPDTVTWGREQIPVLNRAARLLDRIIWDSLRTQTGVEPW